LHIYNTKTKQKEKFVPLEEGKVRIYLCGPTVYDDAHLGHARSALVFDLLRRVLKFDGYDVIFVRNVTDIDDKIINKAKESEKSIDEITSYYLNRFHNELEKLNILPPTIEPKATQNLQNIIEFIQKLIDMDFAYTIDDGVYFDVSKDKRYFSLSHRDSSDEQNIARVEQNSQKRDPKDYALWKFVSDKDIGFDSPFGRGRPGWHIECSAMIKAHLSTNKEYQIDIHCGGSDLIFPHHENEASQSRCESGVELAKYWMHNGFVQINNQKMSKSLGNSFFLKDALDEFFAEPLRYYLLSSHYRSNFNFSHQDLQISKKRLDKLYRLKKRVDSSKRSTPNKEFKKEILDALRDDLNISKALSVIDEMINDANEKLDLDPKNKSLKNELNSNFDLIFNLLGFGGMDQNSYFKMGLESELVKRVEELISQRDKAKIVKDYKRADEIRDELKELGIKIMDTPQGTIWERDE